MADVIQPGEGLTEWQRQEVARHFTQTRHMCYGGAERIKSLYFRLPYGHPDTIDPSAPATVLAELAAAAAAGTAIKVGRLSRPDSARMSELLRQSADRASREGRDETVTRTLAGLCRSWDEHHKVAGLDEYQRGLLVRSRSL